MEKISFTNARGEVIHFDGPPFYLVSIDGLSDVAADNQSQKSPYQDGSTHIDTLLEERFVTVNFLIAEDDGYAKISEDRARSGRILNPKLGLGTLRYENAHLIREIRAIAEALPTYPDSGSRNETMQKGMVMFKCPDPYWKSPGIMEEPIFEPLFQFPFEGPFQMGMQRDQRVINNDGDAETPLVIEFYGPALNPTIINNTTGEFIKVNQELMQGEIMRVNTSDSDKSVVFVSADGTERNVFNWIDLNSTFFKLVLGENSIEYTADSSTQGARLDISYMKRYTAV